MKSDITPSQVRAARALLDWSREVLAGASGATVRTLLRFEAGETAPRAATVASVKAALEAAGVEFIDENGGGPGVRLRKCPDR
jgi:transcriptional regulator with XRE-family HTH domain